MSGKLEAIRKLNLQAWDLCKKDGPQAFQLAKEAQSLISTCPNLSQKMNSNA